MNTMPQVFDASPLDAHPVTQGGFSVSGPRAAGPTTRAPRAHLTLVGAAPQAARVAASPLPYDLSARRHLARVPERQDKPAAAQGPSRGADNAGITGITGITGGRRRTSLEPLVFALVLLVSVAALAVAMRAS